MSFELEISRAYQHSCRTVSSERDMWLAGQNYPESPMMSDISYSGLLGRINTFENLFNYDKNRNAEHFRLYVHSVCRYYKVNASILSVLPYAASFKKGDIIDFDVMFTTLLLS